MFSNKFLILMFVAFGLTACGDSDGGFEGLALKQVPLEAEGSQGEQSITEELEEEGPAKLVSFRDKVLRNSDISEVALDNAIEFYDSNLNKIKNKKVISVFDITKHSGKRRLYVINTNDGSVTAVHVSHGNKSDLNHDGIATDFSNKNGSNKSSLGFMLTAETYYGKNGLSLKLDGQEARNSKVRSRYVVIHGADYVKPSLSKMGRSQGCPAVSRANTDWYINKVKNGSLLYIYHADHDG